MPILKHLFLDTPAEFEKRIDRMVAHIRHAEMLYDATKPQRGPDRRDANRSREFIWLLLRDAMHTARNTPDNDRRRLEAMPTIMPGTRVTLQDAWEITVSRLQAGMSAYDATKVRQTINQSDQDRMLDVLDLLRFVQGRNARRMVKVTQGDAAGLSLEQCLHIWAPYSEGLDRRTLFDIRSRTLGQMLQGLDEHFGLVRTARGFRRLTVREIEKRARRRAREEADNAG